MSMQTINRKRDVDRLPSNIASTIMLLMNWQKTISELLAAGLTQIEIAKSCGCAQSTISEILNDEKRVPSYPIGAALLELHKKKTRRLARMSAA